MANILILGATSAVASELAKRLARSTNRLFLVARNETALDNLITLLGDNAVGSVAVDFNDTDIAPRIVDQAIATLGSLDLVLIAHGYLGNQLQSEEDFEHAYHVIHTNYMNVIALLIPLVAHMKKQGAGKVAVLSSVAGDRGRPRNFTYGSAKGALNLYLQGLRSVLYNSNIEIYSFKLGPVDSPMTVDHEKNFSFSSVDKVATLILSALKQKRYTRYIPGYWFWVMLMVRVLPEALFQKLKFLSAR